MSSEKKKKKESTKVWLEIGRDNWIEGNTGNQHGHAEMDALHKYIDGFDSVETAVAAFKRLRVKNVKCPEKDVCKRCTTVLQGLGFSTCDDTEWGDSNMGKTEWGASMKVKDFLRSFGIDAYAIAK